MNAVLKFGERVPKSEKNKHGWRLLYQFHRGKLTQDSLLGHKSILCFAGETSGDEEDLNGYCKDVEHMLTKAGLRDADFPKIYAVGFETETIEHRYHLLKKEKLLRKGAFVPEYRSSSKDEKEYWKPFFEAYFMPLLFHEDGQVRSILEIKKNLQNLTILTHCHGGFFAHEIESELYTQIKEFYPEQAKALMGQLRMIHLASRKLIIPETQAKHFHVISQNDDNYADIGLEYDQLNEALHREKISSPSLIFQPKKNELILLLKQLTTVESFGEKADDHNTVMAIFAEQGIDPNLPGNANPIHLVQKLLKHFVTHPDDSRSFAEILKSLSPDFFEKSFKKGRRYFQKVKEDGRIRRGLLSVLSHHCVKMAPTQQDRRIFLQRDDKGRDFYQRLVENYQKTGNSFSLISFLKSVKGFLPTEDSLKGIEMAIKNQDWILMDRYIRFAYVEKPEDIQKILDILSPDDLPRVYKLLRKSHLEKNPIMVEALLKRSKKIKNTLNRLKMQYFFSKGYKKTTGIIRIVSSRSQRK